MKRHQNASHKITSESDVNKEEFEKKRSMLNKNDAPAQSVVSSKQKQKRLRALSVGGDYTAICLLTDMQR